MVKRKGGQMFDPQILWLIVTVFVVGITIGFLFGKRSVTIARQKPVTEKVVEREVKRTLLATPLPRPVTMVPVEQKNKSWFSFFEKKEKPKIAIVIDDVGNEKKLSEILWSFPTPVTIAILPQISHSGYFAAEGKKRGFEVILHQPMEPIRSFEKNDLGMIEVKMTDQEIIDTLSKNLASVPTAEGINNHKGSKATQDEHTIRAVVVELKKRGLFYLDSMTSPTSIGWQEAKAIHLPFAQRDVFLDNETETDYIHGQIDTLAQMARKRGYAVGIGHYKTNTLLVLKEEIKHLEDEGFDIVPLKKILR